MIGDSSIVSAENAKNLGVTFDSIMSLENHVANISRAAYYHLHAIGRVRRYLDLQSAKQLVHAMVISRLDTCNSLLCNLPDTTVKRLQRVQNACAKTIMGRAKKDHVTPLLKELHWLPVKSRINYKLIMIVFKCLHGIAPQYLSDLLTKYEPGRSLRSENKILLVEPPSRTKIYGNRTLSYAAPRLWNQLPLSLRQCEKLEHFKSSSKTHLFRQEYE